MKLDWQTVKPYRLEGDTWQDAELLATDAKGNTYFIQGQYLSIRDAHGVRRFSESYSDLGPAKAAATRFAKKVAGEQTLSLKLSVDEWEQLEELLAANIGGKQGKAFNLYCKLTRQAESQQFL